MASRSRWIAALAILGCDHAPPPDAPRAAVLAACETPMLEDAPQCTAPPDLEPDAETTIAPMLPGTPNLRDATALVRVGPDLIVAAGRYGDFFAEGAWAVAIDPTAARVWSDVLPSTDDLVAVTAVGDADGVWIAAAQFDDTTLVRRHDLTGAVVAEVTVADFTAVSLQVQPLGAVAMSGTSGGSTAYVGLAVDGAELWNGAANQAEGPRVIANGTVEYFDGPGASDWEHDPRGTPDDGFPIEVGIESAIISTAGDVFAIGAVLGPLGDSALVVRLSSTAEPAFSQGRPRAHALVVLEGAMDTTVVAGESFHCGPATYLAVFNDVGELLQESRVVGPTRPWVIDPDSRAASVGIDANELVLRAFEVES